MSVFGDCDDTKYQRPGLSTEAQHVKNVDYYSLGDGGGPGPPCEVAQYLHCVSFRRAVAEGQPADGTTWLHATQIAALGAE